MQDKVEVTIGGNHVKYVREESGVWVEASTGDYVSDNLTRILDELAGEAVPNW